jgi:hypothetical protein
MEGHSNKVIARDLRIAEPTVKTHVKNILNKIGATNRTQAAMWGRTNFGESWLLPPPSSPVLSSRQQPQSWSSLVQRQVALLSPAGTT